MSGMEGNAIWWRRGLAEETPVELREEERIVLGSAMVDASAAATVSWLLTTESFTVRAHQQVFAAILRVIEWDGQVSEPAVAVALVEVDALEAVGGREMLRGMAQRAVKGEALERVARRVFEAPARRRVYGTAERLSVEMRRDEARMEVLAERAIAELEEIAGEVATGQLLTGNDVLRVAWEELMAPEVRDVGVVTGFAELDEVFGGAHRGEIVGVWGEAGAGMIEFGLQWALHAALRLRKQVVYLSTRMEAGEIGLRLMEMHRGESSRAGDEVQPGLMRARRQLEDMELYVGDQPERSPLQVAARARRMHVEHGVDVMVVDGVPTTEVARWGRTLRRLVRQIGVPLVVVWCGEEAVADPCGSWADVGLRLERIADDGGDVEYLTRIRLSGNRVPPGRPVHLRWNEACRRHEEVERARWQ